MGSDHTNNFNSHGCKVCLRPYFHFGSGADFTYITLCDIKSLSFVRNAPDNFSPKR